MASYNKFNCFTYDLLAKHDFETDVFKIYLSNATPSASADFVRGDLAEIGSGNGYTTGGNTTTITISTATGVAKVTGTDPTTWTASGGTIGPFQYAVFYNTTAGGSPTSDPLIAWWDYGSAVTLQIGETFTVDLDASNGIFTVT